MARGDRRPGGRRRPRRPRRPRRVGPSVPDIAPRPRDHRGFAAARPEFFVWLFSGGNSRPGKSGVHYTQLDARVAPRYVRQTALLLTSPYYIASHRFPSRFSLRRFGTLHGSPRARFPLVTLIVPFLFIMIPYEGTSWEIDYMPRFLFFHRAEYRIVNGIMWGSLSKIVIILSQQDKRYVSYLFLLTWS